MLYNKKMTYLEIFRWGQEQLERAQVAEAAENARLLLEFCCGTDRNTLLAHGDREISSEEAGHYEDCIARRGEHIPLQHITGEQDFMGLTFRVDENVLIPRQDTEILVEEVMRHLHDGMRILDMCTGSGCILLSLLHYSNGCTGVGVDLSEEALHVARENTDRILRRKIYDSGKIDSYAAVGQQRQQTASEDETACSELCAAQQSVLWIQGNLFEKLNHGEKFDIIVSNPPYIKTDVISTLMPEVRDHEPRLALDGREDGLLFYREITAQAGRYLIGGGMLFFEIGFDQGEEVRRLMENAGYVGVRVIQDYAGLDRVVYGERGSSDGV